MRTLIISLIVWLLFPVLVKGAEKEATYLKEKMIPLAQEFVERIGLTNSFPIGTNQVSKYKVDYFKNRPGCLAEMRLTNDCFFGFETEGAKTEIWEFRHIFIKTYYALDDAPKEKIEAVKALNLKNKLNDKTALALAKKYFKLLGYKEEDFRPPEFRQSYWVGKNDIWGHLPYYEIIWYRKDIKIADVHSGVVAIPQVTMTISGIDSSLVSYSKLFMPIGKDF